MCKFILIQGKENAGKTTTCWEIYKDLVTKLSKNDNGHPVVHEFIIPDREITLQTTSVMSVRELTVMEEDSQYYQPKNDYNMDFIAVLPINSKRIGIISAGDNSNMMQCALKTCLKRQVDMVVMAARSWDSDISHFCGEKKIIPLFDGEKPIKKELTENNRTTIKEEIVRQIEDFVK